MRSTHVLTLMCSVVVVSRLMRLARRTAAHWPEGTCRILAGPGGGDGDLAELRHHVEEVAVAIVLAVLGGMCLCCAMVMVVVRKYYWRTVEALVAQRKEKGAWRKGARRFSDEDKEEQEGGEQVIKGQEMEGAPAEEMPVE